MIGCLRPRARETLARVAHRANSPIYLSTRCSRATCQTQVGVGSEFRLAGEMVLDIGHGDVQKSLQ